MIRLLCICFGYLFGLIQTSYIFGRLKGIDIRKYGSGNAGATNSFRVMGKTAGVITLIIDMCKAIVAIILANYLFLRNNDAHALMSMYVGLGVVLGHDFPIYLRFKGGKGMASTGGAIIGFGLWQMIPISIGLFVGTMLISGYVSLASIVMCIAIFIEMIVFGQLGIITNQLGLSAHYLLELYMVTFIFSLAGIIQHRANIKRLLTGTENSLWRKKNN